MKLSRTSASALFGICTWLCTVTGAFAQTTTPPERTDDNVIVASYNIKWAGSTPHDLSKLAKVISLFDVCGILEIKKEGFLEELTVELNKLTKENPWRYAFGQKTRRPGGTYYETYGVVWRRDRVQLGNGLISGVWDRDEDFRNDPYMVSFVAGDFDFLLVLIHTRYTDDADGNRKGEIESMGRYIEFLRGYLEEDDIILAGDFNEEGGQKSMKKMAKVGALLQLDDNPLTTFPRKKTEYVNRFDHIYATRSVEERVLSPANALDVTSVIYGSKTEENMESALYDLSDHLPVFVVLER